jgi:PAS domain S-box-containing protein
MKNIDNEILKALLADIPDSIYFKNIKGAFVMVNKAKAENSRMTVEEMIGKTDFDFIPLHEAEKCYRDDREVMQNGKSIIDKVEKLTRTDGRTVSVSVTKTPWRDEEGTVIGLMGISRDVTKRIEMEKNILDMLSIATHDIHGPLVSIEATLKLLIRGSFGAVDESVKSTLQDLYERMKNLSRVVNTYLSKSSIIGMEALPKEKLDLRQDIVDPILSEFSREIEDSSIHIDNKLGAIPGNRIMVEAHKSWLGIIYRNLISNAIRYGGKGCTIAFGFEDLGIFYKLNVYNNGPSIPLEQQDKIFKKFHSNESTGLGLSICQKLIRKHGGEMWYEDLPDSHPNFVFTLPK